MSLPVRVDIIMDFLQQAKNLAQWRPKNIHWHQAAVPRRHCGLHQHLLNVGNWRAPVLQHIHKHKYACVMMTYS